MTDGVVILTWEGPQTELDPASMPTESEWHLLQALYGLWRKLSEVDCTDELPLLRAQIVSAGADASLRMLVPRLHVFLPKAERYEETLAANMALLPGKLILPHLHTHDRGNLWNMAAQIIAV